VLHPEAEKWRERGGMGCFFSCFFGPSSLPLPSHRSPPPCG
jgi:hypothetical protein